MPCCDISLASVEFGSETMGTMQIVFEKVINGLPYFSFFLLYQRGTLSTKLGGPKLTTLNIACMYM
jgi:hypothetical protein